MRLASVILKLDNVIRIADGEHMDASGHVSPIASLRAERGWSQVKLAEASGVSQPVIARLETGMQQPKRDHLEKIAAAFGMAASDLLKAMEGGDQVRATMVEPLADRVRQRRSELCLSQAALAEKVGVSQQTIQQIEAGKSDRTGHIVDIAAALGVSPEWLQAGSAAEEDPASEDDAEFQHRLRQIMVDKGFNMRSLSDAAGLGPTTVRDILERGRSPGVRTLRPLAAALGVSIAQLMGEEGGGGNLSRAQVNMGISHNIIIRRTAIEAAERIVAQAGPINAAPRDIVRQIVTEVFGFQVEGGTESR